MYSTNQFYTMDSTSLPGDPTKEAAVRKTRPLRHGLIVLRPLQMSLAFAAFVVTAAWLATYVPVGAALRNQQDLGAWKTSYLAWLEASVGLCVCLMLLALINIALAITNLWFTVRQHSRQVRKCWLCHLRPDPRYTADFVSDVVMASAWFLLMIIMAIIDKTYMDELGINLSDVPEDPLSVAVVALPVLVMLICITSAVFTGLMRKHVLKLNSCIVPQQLVTTYTI